MRNQLNGRKIRPAQVAPTHQPIIGELVGDDRAQACGISVQSSSPVLSICRALLAAKFDGTRPLYLYHGSTLCLRIRSICEAAELRVNNKGSGFVKAVPAVPTASPVRLQPKPATLGDLRAAGQRRREREAS